MTTEPVGADDRPRDPGALPRAPLVKLLPPRPPSWYVARPSVEERLDEATEHRLTLVVAGAGYGKTTHLAVRAHAGGWAWYSVDRDDESESLLARGLGAALAGAGVALDAGTTGAAVPGGSTAESLAASLANGVGEADVEVVLVVDDVHELGTGTGGSALLESLVRYAPPGLHLVLGSRDDPPFQVARLRSSGGLLEIGPRDLAFAEDDVEAVLRSRVGADAAELAGLLLEATDGWPVAVYLATEALRSEHVDARRRLVQSLVGRSEALFAFLADEVIGRESPEVVTLLRTLAELGAAPVALVEQLGSPGTGSELAALARRGLVVELPGGGREYALHALVRAFVRAEADASAESREDVHRRAARWYAENDRPTDALREAILAGDAELTAELLRSIAGLANLEGSSDLVIEAAATIPPSRRPYASPDAICHACLLRGEVRRAREWMAAWAELPAELDHPARAEYFAVLGALLATVEGSTRDALAALQGFGAEPTSFIASYSAYQLLSLGRVDEAEAMAERGMALALAGLGGGPWAESDLVEAHQAAGEVDLERGRLAGAVEQLGEALRQARRIGNALAECATLLRLSEVALRRGDASEALAHADTGLELADRIGFSLFQSSARLHQGRALRAFGRLDAAMSALEGAVGLVDQPTPHAVAGPLVEIGEIHLDRGEVAQARGALERALAATEASGDVQTRSRALAALVRLVAGDSPGAALELLEQGPPADAPSRWRSARRLAEGWVALRADEVAHAAGLAAAVIEEAGRQGDHDALAEGLALQCLSQPAPAERVDSLVEAAAIWRRLGHALSHARAVLVLRTLGADVDDAEVAHARSVLARQAVRVPGLGAGLGALIAVDRPPPLAIRTFGRFAVYRDGDEVPPTEWQSRKARDLLKLLVCRREAVAVRDVLLEALWPDEDPSKTRNRLSVALNVVRGVLDPEGRFDADRFVISDRDGLRLDLSRVDVDVEVFLGKAKRAFEAARAGAADARALLEEAEAAYGGEFLEEDAFADWAAPLRERVRSAYVDLLRALTRTEQESDRFHLRLLAVDPFDEDVHLDLVRMLSSSGRHGEARRAHRRYVTRMAEIGVEPEPLDLTRGA